MDDRLKKVFSSYLKISQEIEVYKEGLNEKKEVLKEMVIGQKGLEDEVISGMRSLGEDAMRFPGKGIIQLKIKQKREGISKKFLENNLTTVMNLSTDQAKEKTVELYDLRSSEDVDELKYKPDLQGSGGEAME